MNKPFEYIKEASPFGSLRQKLEIKEPHPFDYGLSPKSYKEYLEALQSYNKMLSELPLYPLSLQPSSEWMQRKEYEEGVDFFFQNRYIKTPSGNWISGIGPVAFPIEKKGDDLLASQNHPQPSSSVATLACTEGNSIEQDFEGYPEPQELDRIKNWDTYDVFNLIEYVCCKWSYQNWGVKKYWEKKREREVLKVELHTAGWSGNEDLINALLENRMFTMMWYESWRRGGHYYFEINPFNVGFVPVSQLCQKLDISKQAVHQYKDRYDWLNCGNKVLLVREKKASLVLNSDQEVHECDARKAEGSDTAGSQKPPGK